MIEADLHCHTFFSACGIHTHVELLKAGREKGLKALAVTDHGPALEGRFNSPFFERFQSPVEGIQVLKGMECNPLDGGKSCDMPAHLIHMSDILLVGIHETIERGKSQNYYTDLILKTMIHNTFLDVITHPNSAVYPVDYKELARAAAELGFALELNNSKVLYKRIDNRETIALMEACAEAGCLVTVNTDTHALQELGDVRAMDALIADVQFPESLIINRSFSRTMEWIESRRSNKTV